MTSPLISIVTVVYQGKDVLEKTIASVLSQVHTEYIIVDGGSNDGTREIIQKYGPSIQKWVSEKDKGIYDAMNKGVSMASGDWIIFMNSGDTFYNTETLQKVIPHLERLADKTIVYGDAEIVTSEGKHIQHQQDRHLDLTKSVIHQSMFIRRRCLQQNPYDLRYRVMADYDHLLKISTISPNKLAYIPEVICTYDKFGISSKPLYTYFKEYYEIARRRMPFLKWLSFNFYIIPRLIYSYSFKIGKK